MKQNEIYLIPYNDISLYAVEKIEKLLTGKIIGFIDKIRKGESIIATHEIIEKEVDMIVICSTGYYKEIYKELISLGIKRNKIIFYDVKQNEVYKSFYTYHLRMLLDRFFNRPIINNKIIDIELYFGNNSKLLKSFENKHKNKRAFILGNGPSLNLEDIEKLKDEITFAANKIYLLFNETKWRPSYYFVEDDLVFKQNYEEIKKIKGTTKFFPTFTKQFSKTIEDAIYYRLLFKPYEKEFPQISSNPIHGFYWGSTVVYSMIQMALYMGIKEIYFLGMDFDFKIPQGYEINSNGRKDLICEGESNHFHKEYRKVGEKWNTPNFEIQKRIFEKTKKYAMQYGINIYNSSRNSKLKIFEKINFDKLEL